MTLLERTQSTNPFRFKAEKALEVIVYLATHLPNPTYAHIFKVLYYADIEHLRRYCRFISGDSYTAMENGAVPSKTYDIIKDVNGKHERKYYDIPSERAFFTKGYLVKPLREPNLDYLSKSDIECLDKSIKENGGKSKDELSDMSHNENAYKQADEITNDMSVYVMANDFEHGKDLINLLRGD